MHRNTIFVTIRNHTVQCLLDSGASVSCMSAAFLQKLKIPLKPLREEDNRDVFLADGHPVQVQGRAEITVTITGLSIPCEVLILPQVGYSLILGLDFLEASGARIDFDEKVVTFYDNLTATRLSTSNVRSNTVCTLHATVLPPLSETLVPVLLPAKYSSDTSIIEPFPIEAKRKFICARSAIDSSKRTAVCKVLNPTNQVLWLPRHKSLACVEPILSDVLASFSDDNQEQPPTTRTNATHFNHAMPLDGLRVPIEKHDNASSNDHDNANKLTGTEQSRSLDDLKINYHSDNLSADENARLKDFLKANLGTFSASLTDLGRTSFTQHSIHTGSAVPIHQKSYRHSIAAKAEIASQTEKMLSAGLIEPSDSMWSSPVVLVKKKNGEIRFCVDYRKLNAVTAPISFPLPQLTDIFDAVTEAKPKYFSLLDLRSGYHQISLHPDSREKSSFITHQGQFQFRAAPFGLKNLPSFFQLLMSRVFQNLHFKSVLCYLDDILVYSQNFDQHLVHLQEVFDRLNDANLKLHPRKCSFGLDKILYLGHVLSPQGVAVDDSKVKVIRDYPRPRTPKEIRSFLGLASYYRKFIANFSIIASPLNRLLRKDMKFVWDDSCEEAFVRLRQALTTAPVLIYPDMTKPFIINCDSSSQAIGFVLAQEDASAREHPIAFGGRSLTACERAYSVTELEMLAMICAIKQFHCYLANSPFTVYTDHISLKYLQSLKMSTSGRLLRWSLQLQQYTFDVRYKKGKTNTNADALSRRSYPISSDGHDDAEEHLLAQVDNEVQQVDLNLIVEDDLIAPKEPDGDAFLIETANEQNKCLDCQPFIRYLESGELPENDKDARKLVIEISEYALHDGLLFHYYQPRSRGPQKSYINQLVVPKSMRQRVLNGYHEECSHPGFHRCYLSIRRKYYWRGMHSDLHRHITSCRQCQECKYPVPLNKPPLTSLPIKQIFGRWHMDILKLPRSKEGYNYILLCVESLTRWPEMIMLKQQTAEAIAQALYREIFTRFGPPETLLSDRGANFLSKIVTELSSLFGVTRIHTASYSPRCNGACEIVNRSIWKMLRLHCKNEVEWPDFMPAIMYALRATTSANLGHSPAFLLFGRDLKLPVDQRMGLSDEPQTTNEYVKRIGNALEMARQEAVGETLALQARNKRTYDLKATDTHYAIGSLVWLFNPVTPVGKKPKLYRKFIGPYYITSQIGPYTYLLRHSLTNKLLRHPVNADRLKPYVDRRDFMESDGTPPVVPVTDNSQKLMPGTSPDNVASPSPWIEAEQLSGMKFVNKQRFYRVIFRNKSFKPEWIHEKDVSDCLKREFHIKRTMSGKVRKRPTPERFMNAPP